MSSRNQNQVATLSIVEVQQLMSDSSLSTLQKVNKLKAHNFRKTDIENLLFMHGLSVVRGQSEITENSLTFGVEIECITTERRWLVDAILEQGIKIQYENYNHTDSKEKYKIVTDSSINSGSRQGAEIVSPILKGANGLKSLKKVCDTLKNTDTDVNNSCGLHIHIGAEKFNLKQWQNLYINYYRLENIIDSFMPTSRRDNEYCKKINGQSYFLNFENKIRACNDVNDIRYYFNDHRYYKINPCSYSRHKTIEFRQHSGTTDFEKISMWVSFLRKLVIFSRFNVVENVNSINDIPFLNDTEKRFFINRQYKFNNISA